jgi:hypothetical protein
VRGYWSKRRAPLTPIHRNPDTPKPHSGAERFTTKAQRAQRGKDARRKHAENTEERNGDDWKFSHPCFRPSVVRVVPGHGGKILTTEITEDTEEEKGN